MHDAAVCHGGADALRPAEKLASRVAISRCRFCVLSLVLSSPRNVLSACFFTTPLRSNVSDT